MIQANFKTVATVLALQVPREMCDQFNSLMFLNMEQGGQFQHITELVESSILAMMHDTYLNITPSDTPLHILTIFVSCFDTFLEHEQLGHLSDFLVDVHGNLQQSIDMLAESGVKVKIDEDGMTIETGGRPIVPAPDMMQ